MADFMYSSIKYMNFVKFRTIVTQLLHIYVDIMKSRCYNRKIWRSILIRTDAEMQGAFYIVTMSGGIFL